MLGSDPQRGSFDLFESCLLLGQSDSACHCIGFSPEETANQGMKAIPLMMNSFMANLKVKWSAEESRAQSWSLSMPPVFQLLKNSRRNKVMTADEVSGI